MAEELRELSDMFKIGTETNNYGVDVSFDSEILSKNINFFLKTNSMQIKELENIIGVSPGYISRTVPHGSKKRLSIDIVWKIAQLFKVGIDSLINDDLSRLSGKTGEMLIDFMDKLKQQTIHRELEWKSLGNKYEITDTLDKTGLFVKETDDCVRYMQYTNNATEVFTLDGDVVGTSDIDELKQLIIVPYKKETMKVPHYDFLFVWESPESETYHFEKVFSTYNAPFQSLIFHAENLYNEVDKTIGDVFLSPSMYSFIDKYISQ